MVLLAAGGYLLLRAPGTGSPDGDTAVATDPTAAPSEVASDAVAGGAGGVDEQTPSPTPSEVGSDAASGGAGGVGGVGTEGPTDGDAPATDAPATDEPADGDDPVIGGGDPTDPDSGTDPVGGGADDGTAPDGGTDADESDADESDAGDTDTGDTEVAGGFGDDVANADSSGDLPNTGGGPVLGAVVLLLAGLVVRPRR